MSKIGDDSLWKTRLESCKSALEANNFDVYIAETPLHACEIFKDDILPSLTVKSVSWGDSMTLHSTGILSYLASKPEYNIIKTFEEGIPRAEIIERRRQALLVDLFLTGSNAISETGKLVNLDMVGNRIAGLMFGPHNVIITIGRNKIVANVEEAMQRTKQIAAPLNAIRHDDLKTPCKKTATCMNCKGPGRICNIWSITEKSFPRGRIKVILINESIGL